MKQNELELQKEKIVGLLGKVNRQGIDSLVTWLSSTNYFTSPASTMFHGNYEGGLAKHSYMVYDEFFRLTKHYGLEVSEETAIVSGLLHDCCKINLYKPNELKSGKLSDSKPYKTDDIFPIGHGEKSIFLIQKHMNLTEQEAMIIRWHMGPYDTSWEDYQDKIEKNCPEAILFHHADKQVSLFYDV